MTSLLAGVGGEAFPKYYQNIMFPNMWHSYGNILILTSGVNAVLGLLVPFYVVDQVQIDIFKLVLVNLLNVGNWNFPV